MPTVKEKENNIFNAMKSEFGYKNKLAAPRFVKVVVSSGTGTKMKRDRGTNDLVSDRLSKITGQKTAVRGAKQSVASFKIREGDPIGVTVTLRGATMYSFLEKLINVAIPRTKDFRGLDNKSVDSIGNMTMSVREHTIFPECTDEELKDVFGFAITMVTTAKNRKEAISFFENIGMPFKK